jgi:UDP-N-acetylglucosamine 2-epimerase (non-hydrolysing)
MEPVKILFIIGTRPEAIKLAPLIHYFRSKNNFVTRVCNTAQHRDMPDEVFTFFSIDIDYDLDIMSPDQTLTEVVSKTLSRIEKVLAEYSPQLVFVQGDTTTAFAGALAAFYQKIKIAHVEAGLRSNDKFSPYPEEVNRKFISEIADYHFAPTQKSLETLMNEGITKNCWNVGNTVIDALLWGQEMIEQGGNDIASSFNFLNPSLRQVLLTCHRRESFGEPLKEICRVIKKMIEKYNDIEIVYPVHPNPNIKVVVEKELKGVSRVHLIEPLSYSKLIYLLQRSYLIMTDSGGIQEEAPAFGKPVVVLRNVTERMEGIEAGNAVLGGTSFDSIWPVVTRILDNGDDYENMSHASNPYGDGTSSKKIFDIIQRSIQE